MTREGSGGWEVPDRPDSDGLARDLLSNNFTFRKLSGGAYVYLHGHENGDLSSIAARNGYTIDDVEPVDGPHSTKVIIQGKKVSRNAEDSRENTHRIDD